MFKRQLICLVSLLFLCIFICAFVLKTVSPDAELEYQRLMSLSDQTEEKKTKMDQLPVQQTRIGVTKQILYMKNGVRLQSRLSSEKTELMFSENNGSGELIEHFYGLICALQEKPIDVESKQHIRLLKAKSGVYSYKNGQLEADEVDVADYLFDGEAWPVSFHLFSPGIEGTAKKVQLSLFKEPSIRAQGFQATLYDWEAQW